MTDLARLAMALLLGTLAVTASAEVPEREALGELRVCADPNNLPFTNEAGEGFENRIAELMAEELGLPLSYTWAPQIMGFVRNTLETRLCDVMIGVAAGYGFVQNTRAYYRSVYTLVVPADSELTVTSLADPALAGRRIGAVSETPPVVPLRRVGAQVRTYPLQVDTRVRGPAREAVEDVASGDTHGAVLWGPLAGYFAQRQSPPLRTIPLVDDTTEARLDYRITMGIRAGEPQWRDWIDDFIERRQAELHAILAEYGVPLLDRQGELMTPAEGGAAATSQGGGGA